MPWILHSSYGQEKGCDLVPIVAVGSCDHQEHLHMISAQRAVIGGGAVAFQSLRVSVKAIVPRIVHATPTGTGTELEKPKLLTSFRPFQRRANGFIVLEDSLPLQPLHLAVILLRLGIDILGVCLLLRQMLKGRDFERKIA